jgi:nitrate reductase NapD
MSEHLTSLVVQVRPDHQARVCAAITALGGEIHAAQGGKLVVTLEAPDEGVIADTMTRMSLLDGVFSAALVFHHHDGAPP